MEKRRRAHIMEQDMLRHEQEQLYRQHQMMMASSSSGRGDVSSEITSSEVRYYPIRRFREPRSNSESSFNSMDQVSIPVVHSDESTDRFDMNDSSSLDNERIAHLRSIHERYEREIAAAQSEEDHYY